MDSMPLPATHMDEARAGWWQCSKDALIMLDGQYRILDVNDGFCRCFGYTRAELGVGGPQPGTVVVALPSGAASSSSTGSQPLSFLSLVQDSDIGDTRAAFSIPTAASPDGMFCNRMRSKSGDYLSIVW